MSERSHMVYQHVLAPGPLLVLQQVAMVPAPEPKRERSYSCSYSAIWAPDGRSILMLCIVKDRSDNSLGDLNAIPLLQVRTPFQGIIVACVMPYEHE